MLERKITCGMCQKDLMNVGITNPDEDITTYIVATCPFCGGESFVTEVIGKFFYGGIGQDQSKKFSTKVDNIKYKDNKAYFTIIKTGKKK